MELIKLKISQLEPNRGQIDGLPTNPRQIKKERLDLLSENLEQLPEMLQARPLIVFPNGSKFIVVCGNMRLEGAKLLKWKEIDCAVLPADTDAKKLRQIATLDNVGFGEWEWDILANEWSEVELKEWGVELQNLDYSDKNKEIDVDDFSEKMTITIEYSSDDYFKVKQELQNRGITAEAALYNYLFENEQALV